MKIQLVADGAATQDMSNRGIIIIGKGGIGKSHDIPEWLDEMKVDWTVTKANNMSKQELIRYLYNNRDREVLILDDAGNTYARGTNQEILKSAFEMRDTIGTRNRPHVEFDPHTPANKQLVRDGIPEEFDTDKPNIIIITNKKYRVDSGMQSRFMQIELNLEPSQVVARILDEVDPKTYGATTQQVKDVAKFITWVARFYPKKIDKEKYNWRIFGNLLKQRRLFPSDWTLLVSDIMGIREVYKEGKHKAFFGE